MADTFSGPHKEALNGVHPFYFGYALFIVCNFIYFFSGSILVHSQVFTPVFETVFSLSTLSARALILIAAALLARRMINKRPARFAFVALAVMVIAVLVVIYAPSWAQQQGINPLIIFITSGILLGIGDAMLLLLWGRLCGTLSFRTVYLYILISYLIGIIVYSGVWLLPEYLVVPLLIVFIILTSFAVRRSVDMSEPVNSEYSKPVLTKTISTLWRPVLGTAIFCFISGLMSQIGGQAEVPLPIVQQLSTVASLAAVLILLIPVLFLSKPLSVETAYRVALPISAAGFLLLPFIFNGLGGFTNALVNVGYLIADIILWCVVADVTRDTKLPAALTFGLSQLVLCIASIAGTVIGYFNSANISEAGLAATDIALVVVYFIAMASLFLFRGRLIPGEDEDEVLVVLHDDEWYAARCQTLGDQAGFTRREFDVLSLIGRGRSIPSTSKALFVSENTVKSHVKSIYQKLGVHSKQELMDLIEAESAA